MPPEATKGMVSSSAARSSRIMFGTSSSPGWPAHSKPSTDTASQPMRSALSAWRTEVHLWITRTPPALSCSMCGSGLRPAVSTMVTPLSTMARMKAG